MKYFDRKAGLLACLLALFCLPQVYGQKEGDLRWGGPFRLSDRERGTSQSTPAWGNGVVYIGGRRDGSGEQGFLRAVTPAGATADGWPFITPAHVDSAPAVGPDGTIYIGCWDGNLYARTPTNQKKWTFETNVGATPSAPAIGPDGTVYFGTGIGRVYAIDANGNFKWAWAAGDSVEAPAIGPDGAIYFGSLDGHLYALTPEGNPKWATPFPIDGELWSAPGFAADGTIYAATDKGTLYAVRPDGTHKWHYKAGGTIWATPVTGPDGTVYFGCEDGIFYALKPEDGTERWTVAYGKVEGTAAIRADGTIIFGTKNNRIIALNPDKTEKWTYTGQRPFTSGILIAPDGTIYAGTRDGYLYSFTGSGVPLSGLASWPAFQRTVNHRGEAAPLATGHLFNLSIRASAGSDKNLAVGWTVRGAQPKDVLVRAIGPTLTQFGVQGALPDPKLSLVRQEQSVLLRENDDWDSEEPVEPIMRAAASVGAFALARGTKDSTVLVNLAPGTYSAVISGKDGDGGIGLVEAYDASGNASVSQLVNLSARGFVGTGESIFIPGLAVEKGRIRLLLRAIGPGLLQFGVNGVLQRPTLTVQNRDKQVVASNTGWSTSGNVDDLRQAAKLTGAFDLTNGSADCAMIVTLEAGTYSVLVSGVGNTTGEVLVEAYALP